MGRPEDLLQQLRTVALLFQADDVLFHELQLLFRLVQEDPQVLRGSLEVQRHAVRLPYPAFSSPRASTRGRSRRVTMPAGSLATPRTLSASSPLASTGEGGSI